MAPLFAELALRGWPLWVGIVLGLEVSRLARNSSDWHRLLEICALADTLILDEDGVYNPKEFNDRLLLGLKGQMSEAEIYVMKARLHGGILSKALRGELQVPLPTGLVYDTRKKVQLDPDKPVCYVLQTRFFSNLLVLETETRRSGLPRALKPMASTRLREDRSLFFLTRSDNPSPLARNRFEYSPRFVRLVQAANLPAVAPDLGERWLDLMEVDKKNEGGEIRFILLKPLGAPLVTAVPIPELLATIAACSQAR